MENTPERQSSAYHIDSSALANDLPPPPERLVFSTVLKLQAVRTGTIPATQGQQAHAAFLALIQAVDPALAAALHDTGSRKPFTLSPLRDLSLAHNGQVALQSGQEVEMRVTLLDESLFRTFIQRFLWGDARPTIRLAEVEFLVTQALTTPDGHPWAGYANLGVLWHQWQGTRPPDTIHLQFASPTAFSMGQTPWGKRIEVFPHPRLTFGSLAQAWDRLALGPSLASLVRTVAEETVWISQYEMHTQMHQYRSHRQLGAMGQVTYLLKDPSHLEINRILHFLADLAFYTGVGMKTTMGMGQCRRLPDGGKRGIA